MKRIERQKGEISGMLNQAEYDRLVKENERLKRVIMEIGGDLRQIEAKYTTFIITNGAKNYKP